MLACPERAEWVRRSVFALSPLNPQQLNAFVNR